MGLLNLSWVVREEKFIFVSAAIEESRFLVEGGDFWVAYYVVFFLEAEVAYF